MIVRTFRSYLQRYATLHRNARLFLVSNVLVNVAANAINFLYLIYLEKLGFQTDFLSVLLVVGIAGAGLGLIPAVPLANRYSARKLLIASDLIGGVAAALQLIAPQPVVLLVTTFLVGASASVFVVLTPPLLTAVSTSEERAQLFSLNAALGFVTAIMATLLGGFLPNVIQHSGLIHSGLVTGLRPWLVAEDALPLQLTLLVFGLLAIPSIWPLFLMDDAVVGASEAGPATSPMGMAEVRRWWRAVRTNGAHLVAEGWRRVTSWRGLRYMIYQAFLGLGAGLFLTYINPYFVNHLRMDTGTYSVVSSVGTILLAVASLLAPLLGARLGEVRGPILAQLCSVPLLVALAFVANVPLAITVYLSRTVLMNGGKPLLDSYVMGILPRNERSAASSVYNVNWQVAVAIGGVVSGWIIAHAGYSPTFLLAAICYATGMALLIPWFARPQPVPLPSEAPTQETAAI